MHSTWCTTNSSREPAYIDNAAKRSDGISPVDDIATDRGILHDNARRHDHVLRGVGQLLQDEVHHLP